MGIHLNLELTDHCNLKCKMCSQSLRPEAHNTPMSFMSWDSWKAAIDGLSSIKEDVAISPHWLGEPTLHPEFERFVQYAFDKNKDGEIFSDFKLHTNAVIFPKSRSLLLLKLANPPFGPSRFRFIHFSIDAYSPESYQKVKGLDRAELVYRNIHEFIKLRSQLNLNYPYVCFGFVVQSDNVHEGRIFLEHWKTLLHMYGRQPQICGDWPDREQDAIYFRPLNTENQEASNLLHAQLLRSLAIPHRPRRYGSF
ncbi:MAG: hypothetical protein CMK59_09115 [Proteobacteria bacterium]|nr:hypothetical protein [Pseudomonadota bacterium]